MAIKNQQGKILLAKTEKHPDAYYKSKYFKDWF